MDWSELLAGAFPAPRDDEPTSLRRDIADELADHLQSALQRQLVTTPDANQARAKVLDRFGDPQEIARQLWLDALKEKTMSQRVMLVLTALMAVTCVAALAAIWVVAEQGRAATLAVIADNRAELEQSRADNQALQARLEKLAATAAVPAPAIDWKPRLKVRVVRGKAGGPPAEGCVVWFGQEVRAQRVPSEYASPDAMALRVTGPDGFAGTLDRFVQGLFADHASKFKWEEYSTRMVDHNPGSEHVEEIVCPESPPFVETEVQAQVDWPGDLRDSQMWLVCSVRSKYDDFNTRKFAEGEWISPPKADRRPNYLVLPPAGGMIGFSVDRSNENREVDDDDNAEPFTNLNYPLVT